MIKLGEMEYPTNTLNDAKSIIFRISFVQDIAQDSDYYMLIQCKMSATGYPSFVVHVGDVYPPVYGTCNYYLHGIDDGRAPRFAFSSNRTDGNLITWFQFFLDMGYGVYPGGVSPSRAVMFVNGTAPFVFHGTLVSSPSGTIEYVTPQVLYSSVNRPPANRITGLDEYIHNKTLQKYSHPNFSDQTRFYKLGFLVLPQNGLQARITLSACQGYQLAPGNKTAPYGPQNYSCNIYIYSGNAANTSGPSIALYPGCNTTGEPDSGCFHYGFVSNNTRWGRPNNVYLAPWFSEPLNKVSVWVDHGSWWGNPMIEVATNGQCYQDTGIASILLTTGFIILPFNAISTI